MSARQAGHSVLAFLFVTLLVDATGRGANATAFAAPAVPTAPAAPAAPALPPIHHVFVLLLSAPRAGRGRCSRSTSRSVTRASATTSPW